MLAVRSYALERTFCPLLCSSSCFVLIYEELPRPLIRLFNSQCEQIRSLYLPEPLVDMCYADDLQSFVLLSEKSLHRFDPSLGGVERLTDYELLHPNRSLSSICALEKEGLVLLYRFGEYLDRHPRGQRIWKRRHLCQSVNEEIFLVRSSSSSSSVLALFIVEWNDVWRVDIFSNSLSRLHTGFRFSSWTRSAWLSQWSPLECCWAVSSRGVKIDQRGQPLDSLDDGRGENVTWTKTIIAKRDERTLTFFSFE